jgi:hypothetical protein
MKRVLALAALAACAAFAAAPLAATTVLYTTIPRSVELSDVILIGHVLRLEPAYNQEGEIVTRVHLLVDEAVKGQAAHGQVFVFDAWGGSLDGTTVETVGEARYRLGEKVLVQLEAIDGEYHTLGLSFGKWNVLRDKEGKSLIVRNLSDLNLVGVSETPVEVLSLGRMRAIARAQAE